MDVALQGKKIPCNDQSSHRMERSREQFTRATIHANKIHLSDKAHHVHERMGTGVTYDATLTDRLTQALKNFEKSRKSNILESAKTQLGLHEHEYKRLKMFAERTSIGVRDSLALIEFMNHLYDNDDVAKVSISRNETIAQVVGRLLFEYQWKQRFIGPSSRILVKVRFKKGTGASNKDLLTRRLRQNGIEMEMSVDDASEATINLHNYNELWPSIAGLFADVCEWWLPFDSWKSR